MDDPADSCERTAARRSRRVHRVIGVGAALAGALLLISAAGQWRQPAPGGPAPDIRRTGARATSYRVVRAVTNVDQRPAGVWTSRRPTVSGVAYGPSPWEKLDVYLPAPPAASPRPVIVWLHSGGWISGTRRNTTDVVQRELTRGFAVVSIDYALAPAHPFPDALDDVKLAVLWTKAEAATYGFDPARVILAGGSSGGQLAALAGVTPGRLEPRVPERLARYDDTVAAVVDFVGPTDLAAFDGENGHAAVGRWARSMSAALLDCRDVHDGGVLACPSGAERAASVAPYLTPHAPPVFMAYGALDRLVPPETQALPLARAWARSIGGDAVWVEVVPDTGHNVTLASLNDDAFDRFLADVVRGSFGAPA